MRIFGLIGYSLTHSFSQKYFTEKFTEENITDARYELFPIKRIQEFQALLEHEPDLCGLNITIPYKEQIIPFLDELDEISKAVGAVNCIKVSHVNKEASPLLKGYNTDVYGFQQSIKPFLEQHHQRALILGTGGASKAVAYVLKQIGIDVCKVSRKKDRNMPEQITYSELSKNMLDAYTLIINTSPLGTFPETAVAPAIPYEYISSKHFLYDLVYNPEQTLFLKKGEQRGAQTMNGLTMLKLQADKAWEIFKE